MFQIETGLNESGDHEYAPQHDAGDVEHLHVEVSAPAYEGEHEVAEGCYDECEICFVHAK